MAVGFPPTPVYPDAIDSDRTLFLVFNTSESTLAVDNAAWAEEIEIFPVEGEDVWADNGFANINGELFYYDAVERNVDGKVIKFKRCARNLGGIQTKFNEAGPLCNVRGFVIAEHHNQLVHAICNVEKFICENFATNKDCLDFRIRRLEDKPRCVDDHECPDVTFTFNIVDDPNRDTNCEGTLVTYDVEILGFFNRFRLDFGDGNFTTSETSGTHVYAPSAKIDPVVTVSNDKCEIIQTPAERTDPKEPPITAEQPVLDIPIPEINFPTIIVPSLETPETTFTIPPLILPCLDVQPGDVTIPSIIIIDPPIPSVIAISITGPSFVPFSIDGPVFCPISIDGPTFSPISIDGPTFSPITIDGPTPPITPITVDGPMPPITPITVDGPMPPITPITVDGPTPPITPITIDGPTPPITPISIDGPSTISVTDNIPSIISVTDNIPSIISVMDDIPSIISVMDDIPNIISIECCDISVIFPVPPTVSVDWGVPPTVSCQCVVSIVCPSITPSSATPFTRSFGGWGEDFQDTLDDDFIEIDSEGIGIPSVIKVIAPKIPDVRIIHDLDKVEIKLATPEFQDIKIIGPIEPLPHEIKIIQEFTIPDSIDILTHDIPKSIMLEPSPDFPNSIKLEVPDTLPSIKIDASTIPQYIQVTGIPETIEVKSDIPSEIIAKLQVPENLEVPLVYKGGPIPIEFNIPALTGEDGNDLPCFALVPCPKK